jgi:hypothetical protein
MMGAVAPLSSRAMEKRLKVQLPWLSEKLAAASALAVVHEEAFLSTLLIASVSNHFFNYELIWS